MLDLLQTIIANHSANDLQQYSCLHVKLCSLQGQKGEAGEPGIDVSLGILPTFVL